MDMKIDKGIPLPEPIGGGRPKGEYGRIVEQMNIGDSVLCDTAGEADAMRSAAIYRGFKIRRRKEAAGWRIWIAEKKGPKRQQAPRSVTPLAAVISAPLVKVEPPPLDDPRVAELHALCIARKCNARVANAQNWVAKGVTADRLREALDALAAASPGAPLNVVALTPLLLQGAA